MYYIIQENLFKEKHYNMLIEMMGKFSFDYEIVKFRPFINTIEFKTDRKDVFCFGAVAMAHAAERYGWKPGSMMNSNHDFEIYSKGFGLENMLNGEGKVIEFTDAIPFEDYLFFARPTKDTKIFTGQVFTKHSWNDYVDEVINNAATEFITKETKILLSPLKEIQQEIRCWVVGGKVITASLYKLGSKVIYKNYDDKSYYISFAQKMVDKFQPAEAFVLDICATDEGLKIIEVNCLNSSGFYDCNLYKLISALENYFI